MSPQPSRRIAARFVATAGAAAAMTAAALLAAPAAGAATASSAPSASSASTAAPPVVVAEKSAAAERPTEPASELGVKRVSSAPGKSVYVTDDGDNITVWSDAGSPSAMIRTAGGGWVGVLAPGRNGPLSSPTSGWQYLLVDDGHPYVDMRYGTMSGRIEVPAADAGADADSGTGGDPSSLGTTGVAGPPASGAAPSAVTAASGRGLWHPKPQASSGAADGTNLILYTGGALIAAVAVAGVGFAVVRRDPDSRF
ncbi:hypothetical protein OG216_07115 [Streptomycetaceae bacterium NBC_01309]